MPSPEGCGGQRTTLRYVQSDADCDENYGCAAESEQKNHTIVMFVFAVIERGRSPPHIRHHVVDCSAHGVLRSRVTVEVTFWAVVCRTVFPGILRCPDRSAVRNFSAHRREHEWQRDEDQYRGESRCDDTGDIAGRR